MGDDRQELEPGVQVVVEPEGHGSHATTLPCYPVPWGRKCCSCGVPGTPSTLSYDGTPARYSGGILAGMADTTIKISTEVRDRLAQLAREQGTTIRDLVTEF